MIWRWARPIRVRLLLLLLLLPVGCQPGGDSGNPTTPTAPSPHVEQQALENLLQLYREAVLAEDIDRLQAHLAPEPALPPARAIAPRSAAGQDGSGAFADLAAFRQALSNTFQTRTVTAVDIPAEHVVVAPDRNSVTFLEVESTLDPATVLQQTRVFRTSWQLARRVVGGVGIFHIAAVTRQGPVVEVATPGLPVAGPPTPIEVRAPMAAFPLAAVDLTVPATGARQRLAVVDGQAHGTFTSAAGTQLHAVQVRASAPDSTTVDFLHRYRLHHVHEGLAQRVVGTGTTRFFAVAVAPDGTVWAGGEATSTATIGTLVQLAADGRLLQQLEPALASLPARAHGRIEDIAVDQRGRLHFLFLARRNDSVVGGGDVILDSRHPALFCQTVNVFAPSYPLHDPAGTASPSTRVVPAADGAVWLAGSDGGVALVADTFRDGNCPDTGVAVQYGPVLRRQDSALPTNTVPALAAGRDRALWVGAALGLTRLQEGQFIPVPFAPEVTVQGDVATLEAYFQAVAKAIFEAQPQETVALGGVSFVQAFGRPLVKEDLSFSAVEDAQGRLWLGTLGGGLRRVEVRDGVPQDTLHLTRQDGLGSNLILALALGPDGALWAATDEGVSRLRPNGESVTITNFSVLEGVPGPVRDVTVDAAGTAWLATDAGLFRLQPGGGGPGGPGPVASGPRLLRIAGNNQSALPGQELPIPLVVRLEDQFGRPVVGEPLTATLRQGQAAFLSDDTTVTNAQGEARFRLQVRQSETDLVVEVAAPARPQVVPVRFLAIIGAVDTPGVPLDVAVAGDLVFVAAHSGGGLQVIDVRDPVHPVYLHRDTPVLFSEPGIQPRALALRGNRAYVATAVPPRLRIVDITHPRAVTFPADADFDWQSDVILHSIDFPEEVGTQTVRAVAVQGDFAYVVTNSFGIAMGTLQVVNIRHPATAEVVQSIPLPVPRPTGLVVVGDAAYVPAGTAGLLVFDLSIPDRPVPVTTLGDPDSTDAVDTEISSGITLAGDFAYLVETYRQQGTGAQDDRFTVLDLQDPLRPRRRGSVSLPVVMRSASSTLGSSGAGLAVLGAFAYLARGTLGLQVVDIRHPDVPRLVGLLNTPSQAAMVTTSGDRLYVLDIAAGLQVVQSPGADLTDTDGDGVIDFFDAFPTDARETRDSDGDGLGDQADADADNDGFTDVEEQHATRPTDPTDARSFPVRLPPAGTTTLVVDAASASPAPQRNGTPQTPYRALSEALQALHTGSLSQVHTVQVRAGTYSPLSTQEIFPLDLSGLAGLRLHGEGIVVLDAGLTATVFQAEFCHDLVIEGFEITQGIHGIAIQAGTAITIRNNQITGQSADGINIGGTSTGVVITENFLADNDRFGLHIFGGSLEATVRQNTMRHNGRHGLVVSTEAHATIADNLSEGNLAIGMVFSINAEATVTNNTVRQNGGTGILIQTGSRAELTGNTSTDNGFDGLRVEGESAATLTGNTISNNGSHGFSVKVGSTATLTGNTISNNVFLGVLVGIGQNTVTLTGNVIEKNGWHGILGDPDDTAVNTLIMQDNTVRQNLGHGILWLGAGSTVTISGGLITQNALHGILLEGGATATIGLDSEAELVVSHNFAAGIFVFDDGSSARINSGRIRFEANRAGAHFGPVTDVFVDTDGDGLGDPDEATRGTDPRDPDTDDDGLLDGFETRYGFDPRDRRDGRSDPDGDGLTNAEEQAAGTNPRQRDTDGDGLHDGDEVRLHETDPLQADTDRGGLTDGEEVLLYGTDPLKPDSDGDGFRDGVEIAAGSEPLEAQSVPTALLYGTNVLRNDVLVLNPDTGQAAVLRPLTDDLNPAGGAPGQLFLIASSPDGRTLYANDFGSNPDGFDNLHTLHPDTGAILNSVPVTMDRLGFLTALRVDASGALLALVCCDDLGRLDPATGVLTRIGPTGFGNLVGLQFDPDFRTLYAITYIDFPPLLVSLDPATGQGTAIARTDLPTRATALAFTADGRMVVAGLDRNLYQLDAVTGASTLLGPMGAEYVGGMSLRVLR